MLLFPLIGQADPFLARLNNLAQSRDVAKLVTVLAPKQENSFGIIKTNGAYDVGRMGWKVEAPARKVSPYQIGAHVLRWRGRWEADHPSQTLISQLPTLNSQLLPAALQHA